jgi:hypothetical protein
MRFINNTYDINLNRAIESACELLTLYSPMANDLTLKTDWKYGVTGDVLKTLLEEREPIGIYTYRPWNPWTKAIGYFDGKSIHINIRVMPLNQINLVGLILHEYAHYCGFTHGNNYKTEDKCLYSVPYYLSENVRKWL